jgi:hypothetical protein
MTRTTILRAFLFIETLFSSVSTFPADLSNLCPAGPSTIENVALFQNETISLASLSVSSEDSSSFKKNKPMNGGIICPAEVDLKYVVCLSCLFFLFQH